MGGAAMESIETTVDGSMEEVEAKVREALGANGFGVLTEIDVAATLKAKLDIDRPPLKILGACNPNLANEALQLDPTVALLLPCNVTLEPAEAGGIRVAAADPRTLLSPEILNDLACDAADKLTAALDSLS